MDIVLPIPDYLNNGEEILELVLPHWMITKIDKERIDYGQTRDEFVFDLIVDGLKENWAVEWPVEM